MKKCLVLAVLIVVFSGCTILDNSRKKLKNEIKSWDVIQIERHEDNLKVWKSKDESLIHYKKGDVEGIVTSGELLDYLLNVLSK